MKIAFKIAPHNHDYNHLHLLAEAGGDEFSAVVYSVDPFVVEGFYVFNFDKNLTLPELLSRYQEILSAEPVLGKNYSSRKLFYNFREVSFIPETFYTKESGSEILDLLFGSENRTEFCSDRLRDQDLRAVYRIPENISSVLKSVFTERSGHAFSALKLPIALNCIDCLVYHGSIRVAVFSGKKLLLARIFSYASPADVVYELLNIFEKFELAKDTMILLHGMIAESSGLYSEINKYFAEVAFRSLPKDVSLASGPAHHPHHFYSHLIDLAQCGS